MWLYRADQVSLFFGGFFHVPRVVDTLTSLSTDFVRKKFHEKWVIWASEVVKIWIFRPQPKNFFWGLKNAKTVKMVKKIEKNFLFFIFLVSFYLFGTLFGSLISRKVGIFDPNPKFFSVA